MFKGITISFVLTVVCTLAMETASGQTKDPLLFPKDNFTVETKTVNTSAGEKKVTYRSYMHIPYVANPVDKDYQSMNVSVPIKVDDAAADAKDNIFSNACFCPITDLEHADIAYEWNYGTTPTRSGLADIAQIMNLKNSSPGSVMSPGFLKIPTPGTISMPIDYRNH